MGFGEEELSPGRWCVPWPDYSEKLVGVGGDKAGGEKVCGFWRLEGCDCDDGVWHPLCFDCHPEEPDVLAAASLGPAVCQGDTHDYRGLVMRTR